MFRLLLCLALVALVPVFVAPAVLKVTPELLQEERSLEKEDLLPASSDQNGTTSDDRPLLSRKSFGFRHAHHQRGRKGGSPSRQKQSHFGESCSTFNFDCRVPQDLLFRRPDGSCNNWVNPFWGQSDQPGRRLLPRQHNLDGCGSASSYGLPNPRVASRVLVRRSEVDSSADDPTMFLMLWGQLVDHDMMLTPLRSTPEGDFLDCCDSKNEADDDCCPITVPKGDFFYDSQSGRPMCLPFIRSAEKSSACFKEDGRDVTNDNTPWLDMSVLYGSTQETLESLLETEGGKMKVIRDERNRTYPPIEEEDGVTKMKFGDTRGDVTTALTMLSNAFIRLHNILAEEMSTLHPDWSHDQIFNEVRKIVSAIGQHITYTQFMDALLGIPNDISTKNHELQRNYYNAELDPRISMVFSTAAFRLHTYVGGEFILKDRLYRRTSALKLRDIFHNPLTLTVNNTHDELIRGMAAQTIREFDNVFTEELTEWLFKEPEDDFGFDLVALNVQRGRDHQLPGYIEYRKHCGLGQVEEWGDMGDLISVQNIHRLVHVYKSPKDVDMYIGMNMEEPVLGSMIGPTAYCYISHQFKILRDADRFFYTNPGQFTPKQLSAIKDISLSSVLCMVADDPSEMWLTPNVFRKIHMAKNRFNHCSKFPKLNLKLWS